MSDNSLVYDKRLQEKSIQDKKLSRESLGEYLDGLTDSSENLMEFDEEGNPTNLPEVELKTLEIKPAAPEPKIMLPVNLADPLADAWEDVPGR